MKSHGAVTVGKDIVEAFVLANYMEENSYRQYMALQIGKPYSFSEEEIALCREKLWNDGLPKRTWDHFHAKLKPLEYFFLIARNLDVTVRTTVCKSCRLSSRIARVEGL
jgi:ribulose-5-phosphate 4-epimerase/fuculose-1-phosphate aldolase